MTAQSGSTHNTQDMRNKNLNEQLNKGATESAKEDLTDGLDEGWDAQWQAVNAGRAALYRWFADMFARELTTAQLEELQARYAAMHDIFIGMGLEAQSSRLQKAINNLKVIVENERALELAADFAQIFLLSGQQSAPPYASYYIEADQMLYGKPAQQMAQFLKSHDLDLHPDFREPKDHISVYLQVMQVWINATLEVQAEGEQQEHKQAQQQDQKQKQPNITAEQRQADIANRQAEFLDTALLNWLSKFSARCQQIGVKTDVYPALTELLVGFVTEDRQALAELR
ncbi:molecular chaperone TorD [Psychrobacter lutiphocae]|uniref:molecular chaperone TorD n=1 Tax=Psychrobacter lutiphocae TaxID=540500 RepID=UPI00037C12A7|nr:molecular chaperone TorD [Psychrobacter lutiphocae]